MNVSAAKSSTYIKIYIEGYLHLMLPTKVDYVYSYIDIHREYKYVIEYQVSGKKSLVEYGKKKLWKKVLKLIDQHYD